MTKKEMFITLLNLDAVKDNAELVMALNHELALLERRYNAPKKPSKKQLENIEILERILAEMEPQKAYTNKEMLEQLNACAGLSSQKLNALLTKGLKAGKIERSVEKRIAYFSKKEQGAGDNE